MIDIGKIVKFLLVNVAGLFLTSMFLTAAMRFGFFPELPHEENFRTFTNLLSGGMWCWIAGGLASLGYFFTDNKILGRWLLAAPLILPFLYDCGILLYLNLKPLA